MDTHAKIPIFIETPSGVSIRLRVQAQASNEDGQAPQRITAALEMVEAALASAFNLASDRAKPEISVTSSTTVRTRVREAVPPPAPPATPEQPEILE